MFNYELGTVHGIFFYTQLPPLVPAAPVKIDFKVTAIVDPNDGLPPSDLTPENSVIRAMIIKSGQASYNI